MIEFRSLLREARCVGGECGGNRRQTDRWRDIVLSAVAQPWRNDGKRGVTARGKPLINCCPTYCRTASSPQISVDFSRYPTDMPEKCGILATPGADLHRDVL
jgi:hypothetical protein